MLGVVLLTGCGKKDPINSGNVDENGQSDDRVQTEAVNGAEGLSGTVENNGKNFVKIGNRIYYIGYAKDCESDWSYGGSFRHEYQTMDSKLYYYDLDTGKTESVYEGKIGGKLYYSGGRIYATKSIETDEGGYSYIFSVLLDGTDEKVYDEYAGRYLAGYDEVTDSVIVESCSEKNDYRNEYEVWQNGECIATAAEKTIGISMVAAGNGYVVYQWYDWDDEAYECTAHYLSCYNIADKKTIFLGELPKPEDNNMFDDMEHCVFDGNKIYFVAGKREGSGGFLAGALLVEAELEKEKSVKTSDIEIEEDTNGALPYVVIENGKAVVQDEDPVGIYMKKGSLFSAQSDSAGPLVKGLMKNTKENESTKDFMEVTEVIGDSAYIIWNTCQYDGINDAGWREAYRHLATYYQKVDLVSGEITTLSQSVGGYKKVPCRIWKIRDSYDKILYRAYEKIEDGSYTCSYSVNSAYLADDMKFDISVEWWDSPKDYKASAQDVKFADYMVEYNAFDYTANPQGWNGTYESPDDTDVEYAIYVYLDFDADGNISYIDGDMDQEFMNLLLEANNNYLYADHDDSEDYNEATYYYINNPSLDESFADSDHIAYPVKFKTILQETNGITDSNDWFDKNNLWDLSNSPGDPYEYQLFDHYDGETHVGYELYVTNRGTGETEYRLDLVDFYKPIDLPDEYQDCYWGAEYRYAYTEDNIIYICIAHRTYADSFPYTGYIVAIDLTDGSVIWKSKNLSSNANNFAILDDIIYAGYGFTDEKDYIYEINKYTGEIINTIPVKTGPDYLYIRDGHLYVRTYDTNYEFELVYDN